MRTGSEFSPAEEGVRQAMAAGALADLRDGDQRADDPRGGQMWGPRRTIRADVLAHLLTEVAADERPRSLRLAGARIAGTLDLEAARLPCPVLLLGCWFEEPVNLAEASIPALRMPGCHLPGLRAAQLAVDGNLELNDGFTASGEVNLLGAHISGQLVCSGATLASRGRPALNGVLITVGQSMICNARFAAFGEVRLRGAHILGDLDFSEANLVNPDGYALSAGRLAVDQDIFFTEGMTAAGDIRLVGARVGGNADFTGCTTPGSGQAFALILTELQAASLILRTHVAPEEADLTGAAVGRLADEPASWPRRLRLRGFTFGTLDEERTVGVRERLAWLGRDRDGYSPQPYEQLAAVYRREGREQDAREVAIARQRARRRTLSGPGSLPWRLWSLLLDVVTGYGYRTWLAGLWLLGWWAAGTLVFAAAYPHYLIPAAPDAPHPAFQPVIYALDVLLPVVDLNQQEFWIPQGLARWFAWASILAGWLLATAVAAAVTGAVKRD